MNNDELIPGGLADVQEAETLTHRFYGPVTVTNTRNAYQGMVKVKLQDGSVKSVLTGDLNR